jgi:hypothetical protein
VASSAMAETIKKRTEGLKSRHFGHFSPDYVTIKCDLVTAVTVLFSSSQAHCKLEKMVP